MSKAATALFGLALLGGGLLGVLITLLLVLRGWSQGEYWRLGAGVIVGVFSIGVLYLGGTALNGLRSRREEQDRRGGAYVEPSEEPGVRDTKAVEHSKTGRFALIDGLKRAGPCIRTVLQGWYFFLPLAVTGFVLALAGLVIMIVGIADSYVWQAVGGGALGVLGGGLLDVARRGVVNSLKPGDEEEQA